MKSLASCTVLARLSCMLHSPVQRGASKCLICRGRQWPRGWHGACDPLETGADPFTGGHICRNHAGGVMNKSMNQLNELIEITRDGQRFYQQAAEEVKDVELQHLFRDLAQAKTQIIQALSVKVAASHEQPSQGGTLTGRMRELYADTRSRIGDHDTPYVDPLEQTEAHILAAFADAVQDAEPDVRALLAI